MAFSTRPKPIAMPTRSELAKYFGTLTLVVLLAGCGVQTPQDQRQVSSPPAAAQSKEPKKPAVDYAKYLPKTPLNEKVAELLTKLDASTGARGGFLLLGLEKLFPAAAGPLLELAANPECKGRALPLRCLDSGELGEYKARVADFVAKAREDKSPDVRAAALWVTFARSFPGATTELLRSFFGQDAPDVRCEVMHVIADTETPDQSRLLLLFDGLRDADESVRAVAVETLDTLGAKVRPAVADLRKLQDSADVYVRGAVLEALAACGQKEDWPAICAACRSREAPIQYRGAKALFHCDLNDPKVVDMALAVFDAADSSQTRCQAARVLAHVWPVQDRIVKRLAKALYEPDLPGETTGSGATRLIKAKSACLWSLRFMGPDAAAAVPDILAAPGRRDFMHSSEYTEALRTIAPRHPETIKIYKAKFAAGDFGVFDADYLHALGDDAGQFADELLALASTDRDRQIRSSWLTGELWRVRGIPAERLLPILLHDMDDESENMRGYACRAIGGLRAKGAPAVAGLIKEVNRPASAVMYSQARAINALGEIGPAAREALPDLRRIFADPETYRSESSSRWHAAAVALAKIDEQERKKILAMLHDDLRQADVDRQEMAIYLAGEIGPPAAPLLDELKKLAADRKHDLCAATTVALIRIGAEDDGAAVAVEDLQSADEERQERGCTIAAFLTKPEPVARVLPILRRLRRDKNDGVAAHAAGAIRALTGEEAIAWDTVYVPLGPQ
jgi:HEAT repeat protein